MQARGATKSENDLMTTISAFTAHKINIKTIVSEIFLRQYLNH